MATMGSAEAKTHFASLLKRVGRGEQVTITKYKIPVAVLVPVDPVRQKDRSKVIQDLKQFSRRRKLKGTTVRDLIEEGRR
jgi:prevent-host-death family protein